MNVDIFEELGHRIEMLAVAVSEIENDLSLIEYFDGEMQLEELKSRLKFLQDRYDKIEDEFIELEDEVEENEKEIKVLEENIEDIKDRYST